MEQVVFGKPLLHHSLSAALAVSSRVIVVSGHQSEKIETLVQDFQKVEVVFNPDYQSGMFSSVKCGALALTQGLSFFISPGDIPMVKKSTYEALMKADGEIRIPVFEKKRGHPVFFLPEMRNEILKEEKGSNLRKLISRFGSSSVDVPDQGILFDVDTQKDFRQLKLFLKGEKNE